MDLKWARILVKVLLSTVLLLAILFTIFSLIMYISCQNIIGERCADLARVVSQENCLSKENGAYDSYAKLLTETQKGNMFCRFSNPKNGHFNEINTNTSLNTLNKLLPVDMKYSVSVTSSRNVPLYTYVDATQRGELITCTLRGYMHIPVFIFGYVGGMDIPIEASYTTLGLKFYKGK